MALTSEREHGVLDLVSRKYPNVVDIVRVSTAAELGLGDILLIHTPTITYCDTAFGNIRGVHSRKILYNSARNVDFVFHRSPCYLRRMFTRSVQILVRRLTNGFDAKLASEREPI